MKMLQSMRVNTPSPALHVSAIIPLKMRLKTRGYTIKTCNNISHENLVNDDCIIYCVYHKDTGVL